MAKKKLDPADPIAYERLAIDGALDLATVSETDPVWKGPKSKLPVIHSGSLVRIIPPPHVSDAELDRVRLFCEKTAHRVFVTPRRKDAVVTETQRVSHDTVRGTANALIEGSPFADKDALRVTVEKILSGVGL
jgi:hypothetical protein